MYEDNEKKIDWLSIIKKILTVIAIILVIFLIVLGVTKCSNKKPSNNNNTVPPIIVNLKDELDTMEEAALEYITKDTLPTEINGQVTIKLKNLIDNNKLSYLVDEAGNICDVNKSYVEITKLENNYAVKSYIVSSDKSDYKISYIGCFDTCKDGEICRGESNTTGGICTDSKKEENKTETNKQPVNTNTSKPNNSTSGLRLMYQYKKYTSSCPTNYSYDSKTNSCVSFYSQTSYGTVVPGKTDTNVDVKYFTSTSKLLSAGYTFVGFDNELGYEGVKTTVTYTEAYCKNSTYNYDATSNTCSKTVIKTDYRPVEEVWEYTWSYSPTLNGWTRTGVTKYN